ncbi:MAG: hypothetical protein J7K72_01625, partial [Candidatus Aenigmarchaeota archaeon]|nr:hypothetical protein [Candidatus Aenigmarchaeota archaeon]
MILEKYGNGIDHSFGFDDRLSETHDISNNISNEVYFAVLYTADLPEINKGGPKRCPCGSGKPPESCCFKHLRPDKNPNSMVEEFKIEHEDIDTYDIPQSHKAYEKHK